MVPLIYVGLRFAVREGGKTIAAGVISEILPNEESDKTLGFVKKQKAKEWSFLKLYISFMQKTFFI